MSYYYTRAGSQVRRPILVLESVLQSSLFVCRLPIPNKTYRDTLQPSIAVILNSQVSDLTILWTSKTASIVVHLVTQDTLQIHQLRVNILRRYQHLSTLLWANFHHQCHIGVQNLSLYLMGKIIRRGWLPFIPDYKIIILRRSKWIRVLLPQILADQPIDQSKSSLLMLLLLSMIRTSNAECRRFSLLTLTHHLYTHILWPLPIWSLAYS